MTQAKLTEMLAELFESKLKSYNENTLKTWIKHLRNYPEQELEKVIYTLIHSKEDFISIGMIHDMIKPPLNHTEKIEEQWSEILKICKGSKGSPDELANKCFNMICGYEKYGYSESEYEKNSWHKRWIELYKSKLESNKYNDIQIGKRDNLKIGNILKSIEE